jgi:integrase
MSHDVAASRRTPLNTLENQRALSHGVAVDTPDARRDWGANWGIGLRARNRLTAREVTAKPPGKYQDGAGLVLDKTAPGAGRWIWRYSLGGQRREMGLGGWPDVTLSQARGLRDRWALVLAEGRDPINERRRIIAEEQAAAARTDPTLAELVTAAHDARKATLRDDGRRGRWLSPLQSHVLPKLGKRAISTLTQMDLRDCLAPIWRTKHPTATKCAQRLQIVFRHAQVAGYPVDPVTVDRAVQLLGHVEVTPQHIAALPWQDMPALWARLETNPTTAHDCLRWLILTAVRQHAGRGARLDEIDGDVWTVPADRVKGTAKSARDFAVPLSPPALALVESRRLLARDGMLFAGQGRGPITDSATQKALRLLGCDASPHGFRTSFRSWVQDTDAARYEVAETALGHTVGGRVERSYARSDLLDARRVLMRRWADFVTGQAAKVVPIRGAADRT